MLGSIFAVRTAVSVMCRAAIPCVLSRCMASDSMKVENKAEMRKIAVYRYNPDVSPKPYIKEYEVDISDCNMVLDALIKIRNTQDPTLAFRRSCREGICGSCGVNINGTNDLACLHKIRSDKGKTTRVYPMPHMDVVRDLVTDMSVFFAAYNSIQPWLKRKSKPSLDSELPQSEDERKKLDGLFECILCACCTTACPIYWWSSKKGYFGPAVLQQAYRWIADSRDEAKQERLDFINTNMNLFQCHTVMECNRTCPKKLNPAKAIGIMKKMITESHS